MAGSGTAVDVRMACALLPEGSNVSGFCRKHKISRQTFYKWRKRFADHGIEGLHEQSRRPRSTPNLASPEVEDAVVLWRKQLAGDGADHGPESIRWHLVRHGGPRPVPHVSTIARILSRRGQIVPEPKKRPKSSLHRFAYDRPCELFQSDWHQSHLADGRTIAIGGTIDDHSRYLGGLKACLGDGTGELVWEVMLDAIEECGVPQRSLTDNGVQYSQRFRGGLSAFEVGLAALGTKSITSTPGHPQTCGKIERLWQTLDRWLNARPKPRNLQRANQLLEEFRQYYNHERPHRGINRRTPAEAFAATEKARPPEHALQPQTRLRHLTVTPAGLVVTGGTAIGIGRALAGERVTLIRTGDHVLVFQRNKLLRELTIDHNYPYQPQKPRPLP